MSRKVQIIIGVVVGLSLAGAAAVWYNSHNNMEKPGAASVVMTTEESKSTGEAAEAKKDDSVGGAGVYVTLADYNRDPSKYVNSKKVYFFHASWCSICQGIDREISADTSKIPTGVTLIKTDFDSSRDLRQKYGVTTQYTFVQIDNNSNETAQWSATSLAAVLAGIRD